MRGKGASHMWSSLEPKSEIKLTQDAPSLGPLPSSVPSTPDIHQCPKFTHFYTSPLPQLCSSPGDCSPRCCSSLHLGLTSALLCSTHHPELLFSNVSLSSPLLCSKPSMALHYPQMKSNSSLTNLPGIPLAYSALTEKEMEGHSDWVLLYACLMFKYYHPGYSSPNAPALTSEPLHLLFPLPGMSFCPLPPTHLAKPSHLSALSLGAVCGRKPPSPSGCPLLQHTPSCSGNQEVSRTRVREITCPKKPCQGI